MPTVDSASFRNGVFDALVSSVENESSDGYLSNEMVVSILRKDMSPEKITNTRQYDGYTFDYNRCIQFNNRILCGYDKNKGPLLDDYTMIDIGNGCRARGDRIECGYDNPSYKNLRHPSIADKFGGHSIEDELDKHSENNTPHKNNHHHAINHHHTGQHHGIKHHGIRGRHVPTRTAAITDPTTPSVTLNIIKTDNLENKSLKPAFDKLVMKAEETSIESVETTKTLIELTTSTTNMAVPLTTTTTTVIPTKQKSTVTSRRFQKIPKSTISKATTLFTKITTTLPINSELNEISDGETNQRIVRLKPVIKQKRRRPTDLLSTLPKLVRKSKSDRTVVPRILNIGKTTVNGGMLRMETDSTEKKVKTACVEQEDRVVCYDFKT